MIRIVYSGLVLCIPWFGAHVGLAAISIHSLETRRKFYMPPSTLLTTPRLICHELPANRRSYAVGVNDQLIVPHGQEIYEIGRPNQADPLVRASPEATRLHQRIKQAPGVHAVDIAPTLVTVQMTLGASCVVIDRAVRAALRSHFNWRSLPLS
jgi:hypothetical protein